MPRATTGYCVGCKGKTAMKGVIKDSVQAKDGGTRTLSQGACAECGSGMFKVSK
jgi:hypothetical protein